MPVHAYMHSRLMEESEARVEMAACFDSPADTLVADRILRNPDAYRRWVAEHGNYVRCSSSYLCTYHLAERLMQDAAFDEPLRLYEQWYSEYFRTYCDVAFAQTEEEKQAIAPMDALRPLLKYQLAEARKAILEMPQMPAEDWREAQIRKPTGDTQRLRTIFGNATRVN